MLRNSRLLVDGYRNLQIYLSEKREILARSFCLEDFLKLRTTHFCQSVAPCAVFYHGTFSGGSRGLNGAVVWYPGSLGGEGRMSNKPKQGRGKEAECWQWRIREPIGVERRTGKKEK